MKKTVIIHGHFYQPPRENPWTQDIPRQENAAPFHDWNERITAECYSPNTRSRVLDPGGRITAIVNNFEHINFNIGPTLFAWLERYHPETYARIVEADQKSRQTHDGHGNAIAQVYNHLIMPLANERDKHTQILWGRQDFLSRFGREPESFWLAETAINTKTVECLINHGVRYVILSPTQAGRVREIGSHTWHDVSQNGIDTTRPYKIMLSQEDPPRWKRRRKKPRRSRKRLRQRAAGPRSLDVFFYDGGLSAEISFTHLLRDANAFVHRLEEAARHAPGPDVLIHAATDGEIYGHHEPFADMCLASSLMAKLPERQFDVTNYAQYLDTHPPTMEVELKSGGEQDEGTAWSCSHGVGRWYRDCGCSIANNPGWNQQWRTPLRRGFDVLRDCLAIIYERELTPLLHAPWKARDAYITCVLDPSEDTKDAFLQQQQRRPLSEDEQSVALRLLEAQKYAMFMYTSCAWFFDDVSGVEILQNMRFAARVIQLVEDLYVSPEDFGARASCPHIDGVSPLEDLVLTEFEQARSNIPSQGTGKDIYLKSVKPDVYTPERAANQFLLEKMIEQVFHGTSPGYSQEMIWNTNTPIYLYDIRCVSYGKVQHSNHAPHEGPLPEHEYREFAKGADDSAQQDIYSGILKICDRTTRQRWTALYTTYMKRSDHPVSFLKRVQSRQEQEEILARVPGLFAGESMRQDGMSLEEAEHALHECGFMAFGLTDLYEEDRERLFYAMIQRGVERLDHHLQAIYEDSREFLVQLAAMHIGIPEELRGPVQFALSYQLRQEIHKMDETGEEIHSPTHLSGELEKLLHISHAYHIELDKSLLQKRVSGTLNAYLDVLAKHLAADHRHLAGNSPPVETLLQIVHETLQLLERAESLGIELEITEAQNKTHDMFHEYIRPYIEERDRLSPNRIECLRRFLVLMERLNFTIEQYHIEG